MKDLLIFTADADAQAFVKAILLRPQALKVRHNITFDVDRHTMRDSGMYTTGAELVRLQKPNYRYTVLIFDYHGSGREHKHKASFITTTIQNKLDSVTWKGRSSVLVCVPELEEWLWHCESALLRHWKISENQWMRWKSQQAKHLGGTVGDICKTKPKELFECMVKNCIGQTISPRDFGEIAKHASITALQQSASFNHLASILRGWFA